MSVGVQREACRKMPQHTRHGLDVHTVLQGQRGEGVPQVVKTNGAQSIFIEDIKKDDHFKRKWSSFFYAEQPVC